MFLFHNPWKHQNIKGFLVFSGGMKWEYWPEMGKKRWNNAFKANNEGSRTLLLSLHKFRLLV